jgi:shikimate kinase
MDDIFQLRDGGSFAAAPYRNGPATPQTDAGTDRRICIIGLMGTGKTTVGLHLAERLGIEFVDSDRLLEARLGCSIREYFARDGEVAFRSREAALIEEIADRREVVLSTGGGAVLAEHTRSILKRRFMVVHLTATIDEIHARTRHDRSRPLLQNGDPLATLRNLHERRRSFYEECANLTVATTGASALAIATRLAGLLTPIR